MRTAIWLGLAGALELTAFNSPGASNTSWTGTTGYFADSTWNNGIPTNTTLNAIVDNGGTVNITNSVGPWDIRAGDGASASGTYNQTAGTATVSGWLRFGDTAGSTGNYNLYGGTLSCLLEIHIGETGKGYFNQQNGTLSKTVGTGIFAVGENAGSFGMLTFSGGTINPNSGFLAVGAYGTAQGYVIQTGGTLAQTATGGGDWRIGGYNSTSDAAAIGIYNLTGGSFTVLNNFQIGAYGSGEMNLGGNGTININGSYPATGRYAGGFGVLDIASGNFNHNSTNTVLIIGEQGTGILNLRGGTLTDYATSTTGALRIGGAENTAGSAGIVNLLGGTLNTLSIGAGTSGSANVSSTFNFNGGTLQARGNNTTFISGLNNAYVYPGGANIDSQGFNVTIGQALVAPAGNGVTGIPVANGGTGYLTPPIVQITGGGGTNATAIAVTNGVGAVASILITSPGVNYTSAPTVTLLGGGYTTAATIGTVTIGANSALGGLTKLGSGTLTLTGSLTYSGTTVASNSLLIITAPNSVASTNCVVTGGANFGVNVTSSSAQLNLPALTFSSASSELSINFGGFGGQPVAPIHATSLTVNGSVTVNIAGSGFATGQFPLVQYNTLTGSGTLALGSLPTGMVAQLITNTPNKSIDLIITTALAMAPWQMKQSSLMTQWASQVNTNTPLPEYPRPQLVRSNWLNLNGIWQFQAGITNSDPVPTNQTLSSSILVPYPMESAISGVMQYYAWSWYRRTFAVPAGWSGKRVILHLDAVNWQSQVYINGQTVGIHKGGYDPFSFDITTYLNGATNELIIQVYSPEDSIGEPRGKQTLYPGGIMYTSSSGIWQPAWLEPVDSFGIQNLTVIPDVDNSRLRLTVNTYATNGVTVYATILDTGTIISTMSGNPQTELDIPINNLKLWSPTSPFLYDLQVSVAHNGITNDMVTSYFGMRKIAINTVNGVPRTYLNNQFLFEMGPLDQGFWPDGIYTAPTDAALAYDIQMEKALGFNTVRKHIKVERQRWYYWADKLGIMVWQDMPSCNSYTGSPKQIDPLDFIAELTAMVTNHWNSPSIIMWDVFNEGQGQSETGAYGQTNTTYLVQLVKTLDTSRLVNQASGNNWVGVGDVLDSHSYPDPGNPISITQAPVDGEYGGIAWHVNGHLWNPALAGTGYLLASSVSNIATLYDGYISEAINYKTAANGGLNAAIYTQITDVENECNGLMTYDRLLKPDLNLINLSNQKAITGQTTITTVVPTSQSQAYTWSYVTNYTTNTIPANWCATNYNASSWSSGPASFGTTDPNAVIRTTWNTSDIWIRRQFSLGALSASDLANLEFNCYHDEDCQIYLNGVLAGSASGYSTAYVLVPMSTAGMNALIPNGTNLIAVHCHQTTGGQDIDVGICKAVLVANTLTVPTDYTSYWPLDATNGTVALDASVNGNNGTVSGAAWNANGQINGCLAFNGTNSFVQVSNLVSNDFSIAFWVKTTQTGGTVQWYNGAGLVDGNYPSTTNDFGTAMVDGKFGFGVGNPDTTILSTNSINDGAWHQCVATRVQSTGLMSVYVDGILQATGAANSNALTASASLRFGQIASGGGFFNGSLDEIKIYGRPLGNNEVTALYYSSAMPPAAPTNLIASASGTQVALSWNSYFWATNYIVRRSTTSGGPYMPIATTTATGFIDTNVMVGVTYYYAVAGVNLFGIGSNSSQVSATPVSLVAWFKADAITGVANGTLVSSWSDASGNTNNATQATVSQQPVYVTNAMNGLPVLRFNSSSSNFLAFVNPVQNDFTMLIVYQSSQNNQGSGTAFYNGSGLVNGDQTGAQNDFGTSLNANGRVIAGTGNPDTSINSGTGFNNGQPHLVTFKRTESIGAIALYIDGTLLATGTGNTLSLTAPPQLYLGAVPSGGGFLTGDIAEVKIFSTALSDSDRAAEQNALLCKYGLSGGAAPAVPTGLTATAGNRQALLNWAPVTRAASYNLWASTNNGLTYNLTATGLATDSYVDTNAVTGLTNYYAVASASACGSSASSAAVGMFLPQPSLAVGLDAGLLNFSWPGWAGGWSLYFTTNLTPPVIWLPVTNAIGSNNGQFNLALPLGTGSQFFRLTSP